MKNKQDYLKCLPYWNDLSDDEKELIARNSNIRSYRKHAILHECGDNCIGMIYVISGSARVFINSEEGREITLFRLSPGKVCVFSAACVIRNMTFETLMSAEEDIEILVINAGTFKKITDSNINVKCFVYELATERFSVAIWVLQQVLFERFDKRLAGFLIKCAETTGNNEIHMTQKEIAERVNSAREVVSRMLRQFSEDGIIEIKRGTILIKNSKALKKLS